jgi:hypothetical protein
MLIRVRSPVGQFRINLKESDKFSTLLQEIARELKSDRKFRLLCDYKETDHLNTKLK